METSISSPPQCRFCRSDLSRLQFTITRPPERQGTFWKCDGCGGLNFFADFRASAYTDNYYGEGSTKFDGVIARLRKYSAQTRAKKSHALAGQPGTCLDIGCGDGEFLLAMQRRGWRVRGFELPGPAHHRALTRLPGCIVAGADFERDQSDESFEMITLWQVFEHLEDPRTALRTIRRLLKPGAWLVIAVPNPKSWQARLGGAAWLHLDPPRHLYLASARDLGPLLESNGFEILEENRPWLEFGVIGILQTGFNHLGFPRDELLDCLRTRWRNVSPAQKLFYLLSITILGVPAALFAWLEAMLGSPATYEIYARRRL